jgi:hypothetical protein
MHMSFFKVVLLLLVAAGVGLAVLQPPFVVDAWYMVKGYGPASTPEEAVERFSKALEARNYHAAARYLEGDWPSNLRRVADKAEKVYKGVDSLRSVASDHGVKPEKTEPELLRLEQLPKKLGTKDWKKSEDSATVTLTYDWDSRYAPARSNKVALKKVDGKWKLELPLDSVYKAHLDDLDRNGLEYANALESIKNQVKNDPGARLEAGKELKTLIDKIQRGE